MYSLFSSQAFPPLKENILVFSSIYAASIKVPKQMLYYICKGSLKFKAYGHEGRRTFPVMNGKTLTTPKLDDEQEDKVNQIILPLRVLILSSSTKA